MTDETPAEAVESGESPAPIPSPAAFLTIAAAAKRNGDDALSRGELEVAGMWRTIETYLRDGARAVAAVPKPVQNVVAAGLQITAAVSESGIHRARRLPDRAGNAYVPYEHLVLLVDSLEAAFPGLVDDYSGKRLTA